MTITTALATEIQSLSPTAVVELFVVDLTSLGDSVYRFHAGTNALQAAVVWQGQTYTPFPCQATGFDLSTNGQLPRPKLVLSNVLGTITALILATKDCVGGKVTRKRTLVKFLDAVNFAGGVNATADATAFFPDDLYIIDRKVSETKTVVEFELAAAFDIAGVQLPRRQIIQNLCAFRYRGSECGYAGPPVATEGDNDLTLANASTTPQQNFINARDALRNAIAYTAATRNALGPAQNALNAASEPVLLEERYSSGNWVYHFRYKVGTGRYEWATYIFWNGSRVSFNATYRQGPLVSDGPWEKFYRIQRWGVNTADQTAKQTAYNNALATYNGAVSAEATAITNYNNASAALPYSGTLFDADVCGKRISSCKKRFHNTQERRGTSGELPFGGFPGAGVSR